MKGVGARSPVQNVNFPLQAGQVLCSFIDGSAVESCASGNNFEPDCNSCQAFERDVFGPDVSLESLIILAFIRMGHFPRRAGKPGATAGKDACRYGGGAY